MTHNYLLKTAQTLISTFVCLFFIFVNPASAQVSNKVDLTKNPKFEKITPEKLHIEDFEVKQMNDFQTRVQQRVNEVKSQGYGGALLLRPFSSTYRLYKYEVINGLAVQDDIILGPLREVVRTSISNRDAGYQIDDPASKPIEGATFAPPLIPDAAFRWKNGVIPYEIDTNGFTNGHISTIEKGIAALNNDTNLTLRERYNDENDFVRISANQTIPGSGQSALGKQGDDQDLFLNTLYENAFNERTVIHEMLHAAGFNHEQTRSDRDNYVRILWKNIEGDNAHNFEKEDSRTYGEYDVESIMHYYRTNFGKDCHISDYADSRFCKNCEIQDEVDFLAAQSSNESCKKYTIKSKTSTNISPSSSLTQKDIDAINAAYPTTVMSDSVNQLPAIGQSRTLSLTIKELTRVAGTKGESGAMCGKYPDFIGEIVAGDIGEVDTGNKKPGLLLINDVKLSKTKQKDKKVGDSVTPNWKLNVPVGPGVKELYVIVKIWEYDDALCGGKNDLVDVSPQNEQAFLRVLVDLSSGEIQHLKPQPATAAGGLIYYQRARQSGYSFFDSAKGEFQTVTFSGLEDGDATSYQMEAQITLEGIIL